MYAQLFQHQLEETGERKPPEVTGHHRVPSEARAAIIGKRGATIRQIQEMTHTSIQSPSPNGEPVFTIRGSYRAIDRAKEEMEKLISSYRLGHHQHNLKRSRSRSRSPPPLKRPKLGGKVPKNWINCPERAEALIDDFILAVKCPLHEKFTSQVLHENGRRWRLEELFLQEDDYGKRIGMIIDLTDTTRYYDAAGVIGREVIHTKMPLNIHDRGGLPESRINRLIGEISSFREANPNDLVVIHCTHGFNRTGLIAISYLCQCAGLTYTEAVKVFSQCRSGGIYRHEILQYLHSKYAAENESKPGQPDQPVWLSEKR